MRKKDLFIMSNQNLWQRKARTILTCLGVVIGTASIVVMISLGIGLRASMEQQIAQWGSLNIINVYAGMQYDNQGNPTGEEMRLTDQTVEDLKNISGVTAVSPIYNLWGEARWGRQQGYLTLIAMDPETMADLEFTVAHGRLPMTDDRFAIVVGSAVINNFWDDRPARGGQQTEYVERDSSEMLDQRIQFIARNQINYERKQNYNFFVVGVLDEKNMDRSWSVYTSIHDVKKMREFMMKGVETPSPGRESRSSAVGRISSVSTTASGGSLSVYTATGGASRRNDDRNNDYSSIMVRGNDTGSTKTISATLREMGYNAWSMADSLEGIEDLSRTLQAILGGIGGITLLVAALGITNTMVMSIYERTREIGIMKVIGASFADVRSIFLMEAGLIGLFGGILGLGMSYGASELVNRIAGSYIQQGMAYRGVGIGDASTISIIPPWLALFALVFAIFIGLAAGLYPASRAIRVSPIVAIRNE